LTVIRTWSGDGVSAGAMTTGKVGTGDTAFTAINSDSTNLVAVEASGTRSPRIKVTKTDGNNVARCNWGSLSGLNLTATAGRVYFTAPTTAPSESQILVAAESSSAPAWSIRMAGGPGGSKLRLYDKSSTQVAETAVGLIHDRTYRIEWTQTANTMTVYLYFGDSSTLLDSITYTSTGQFNVIPQRVMFGYGRGSVVTDSGYFDDMALADTATLIGPVVTGLSTSLGGQMTFDDPAPGLDTPFDLEIGPGFVVDSSHGYDGDGGLLDIDLAVNKRRWTEDSFSAGKAFGACTFRFRFPDQLPQAGDLNGTSAAVFTTKNSTTDTESTGQGHFGLFFDPATGTLKGDILAEDHGETDELAADTWYLVQTKFSYNNSGDYTAQVKLDGVLVMDLTSADQPPLAVHAIGFGTDSDAQTYQIEIDSIAFDVGASEIDYLDEP
jgi:hypothetical protein